MNWRKNLTNWKIKIGYEIVDDIALDKYVDLSKTCHWLACGGSGSGKSVFMMYVLNQLLNTDITLYIGDFKGSGDYTALSPKYAEFGDCVALIEEFYEQYQYIKQNKTGEHIYLIIDEYSGMLVWLESQDKKKASEIKGKVAEILMQGRSLPGGGGAWIMCILQRGDASHFSTGSRDNFMLSVGFSRLSKESRGMLGFHSEDIPVDYEPCTGKALLSIDGEPLSVLQVPTLQVDKLRKLLRKKAERRNGAAVS